MIQFSDRAERAGYGAPARGVPSCPRGFADASGPVRPAPGVR